MGLDHSHVASEAMSEACSFVRRYPKLVHWMQVGDVQEEQVLDNFRSRTAVKLWLRSQALRRQEEVLLDLLDKADIFVNHSGQAGRLMETFRQQRDSGKLDGLHPTARAVHRAVFSLGIYQGAPVLCSLRYVQTVVRAQSAGEVQVSHTAIQKHIKNLVTRGLFASYDPGKRTAYRDQAGTVALETTPVASEPDVDVVLALSLTIDQRLALIEFVSDSHDRQEKLRRELDARRASMMSALMPPPRPEDFADVLATHEWTPVLRPTGQTVFVFGRLPGGRVLTEHGTFLPEAWAFDLTHADACESSYLAPLMCPCTSADVELKESPVSWGLHAD